MAPQASIQASIIASVLVLGVDKFEGQNSSAWTPEPVHKSDRCTEKGNESNESSENKSLADTFCGSTMSSSPPAVVSVASSDRVRSRFLSRLGFSPSRACNFLPTVQTDLWPHFSSKDSFQSPLIDQERKIVSSPSCNDSSLIQSLPLLFVKKAQKTKGGKEMKSVRFDHVVTVHLIPSHRAYSSRIRETLWISLDEMEKSVPRNSLEFAAENWDWHEVVEERDMFYHNGELIHPVHYFNKPS